MAIRVRTNWDIALWVLILTSISVGVVLFVQWKTLPAWVFAESGFVSAIIAVILAVPMGVFAATTIKRAQENHVDLRRMLDYDALTNVFTRARFYRDVERENINKGALLMIDVDHFKRVNDTYGHNVGDIALQELCRFLKSATRIDDPVYRLGGEEFVVYLDNIGEERAMRYADRLRHFIEFSHFELDDVKHKLTISIGVACLNHSDEVDEALRSADEALYAAKKAGRNQVVLYEPPELSVVTDPPPRNVKTRNVETRAA